MPRSCDVCHASSALVYCRADAAFLCMGCDVKVHGANKLASRHERVWMCEVCEQSPAVVTCKADATALCLACDTDIHTANPLASRHERLPVMPFYECPSMVGLSPVDVGGGGGSLVKQEQHDSVLDSHDGDDENDDDDDELSVAEAESWLLPSDGACKNGIGCDEFNVENVEAVIRTSVKPSKEKAKANDSRGVGLFPDDDLFLDLEHTSVAGSSKAVAGDSIVPVHHTDAYLSANFIHPVAANVFSGDVSLKAMYSFPAPSISNSISSSSLDFGVVPDSALCEESTAPSAVQQTLQMQNAVQLEPMAREARVLRYREKRKNRKFEKTIRYASRKAYAEIRPRIKGRFVKRTEVDGGSQMFSGVSDAVYGVVPSL